MKDTDSISCQMHCNMSQIQSQFDCVKYSRSTPWWRKPKKLHLIFNGFVSSNDRVLNLSTIPLEHDIRMQVCNLWKYNFSMFRQLLECTVLHWERKKSDIYILFHWNYKSNVKYNKMNILRNRIVTAIGIITNNMLRYLEWKGIPTQIPSYH